MLDQLRGLADHMVIANEHPRMLVGLRDQLAEILETKGA